MHVKRVQTKRLWRHPAFVVAPSRCSNLGQRDHPCAKHGARSKSETSRRWPWPILCFLKWPQKFLRSKTHRLTQYPTKENTMSRKSPPKKERRSSPSGSLEAVTDHHQEGGLTEQEQPTPQHHLRKTHNGKTSLFTPRSGGIARTQRRQRRSPHKVRSAHHSKTGQVGAHSHHHVARVRKTGTANRTVMGKPLAELWRSKK